MCLLQNIEIDTNTVNANTPSSVIPNVNNTMIFQTTNGLDFQSLTQMPSLYTESNVTPDTIHVQTPSTVNISTLTIPQQQNTQVNLEHFNGNTSPSNIPPPISKKSHQLVDTEQKGTKEIDSQNSSYSQFDSTLNQSNDVEEHTVSFGDFTSYPFCTCFYWQRCKLPCVHMFTIFHAFPGWNYDMLSPVYRMNSVLQFDYSCILQPNETELPMLYFDKSVQTKSRIMQKHNLQAIS